MEIGQLHMNLDSGDYLAKTRDLSAELGEHSAEIANLQTQHVVSYFGNLSYLTYSKAKYIGFKWLRTMWNSIYNMIIIHGFRI